MYFILLLQVIFINLMVCIHSSNYIFITSEIKLNNNYNYLYENIFKNKK